MTWTEVVASARAWGDWSAVEQLARQGIACQRHGLEIGDPLSPAEVNAEAKRFRLAHSLLSRDDTEAWLERWGLQLEEWLEQVRRSLLRERWSAELAELTARYAADDATDVEAWAWVEGVCSGALAEMARKLAERLAVAQATGSGDNRSDLGTLDAGFERFCQRAVTAAAIEREMNHQRLEWLRFDCRWLSHDDDAVVREAALCMRTDGMSFDQVAATAGLPVTHASMLLENSDPSLQPHLLGAQEGDLLGPLVVDGEHRLVEVLGRVAPAADEPDIRQRAQALVVRRAVGHVVDERVRWHVDR